MRNRTARRWVLGAVLLGAATTACSHAPAPTPPPVPTGNYDYTNAPTTTTAAPTTTSSTPTETTSVPLPPTTPVLPFPSAPLTVGAPGTWRACAAAVTAGECGPTRGLLAGPVRSTLRPVSPLRPARRREPGNGADSVGFAAADAHLLASASFPISRSAV